MNYLTRNNDHRFMSSITINQEFYTKLNRNLATFWEFHKTSSSIIQHRATQVFIELWLIQDKFTNLINKHEWTFGFQRSGFEFLANTFLDDQIDLFGLEKVSNRKPTQDLISGRTDIQMKLFLMYRAISSSALGNVSFDIFMVWMRYRQPPMYHWIRSKNLVEELKRKICIPPKINVRAPYEVNQ